MSGISWFSCSVQSWGGVACIFHLRVTTLELQLRPRVCPSDGLGAAPGVDPWHLLEKWSIKCAPKQGIWKGTCCREPHDGSTAKSIDLRKMRPSGVPVTSGFPCCGLAAAGPASIPCPSSPLLLQHRLFAFQPPPLFSASFSSSLFWMHVIPTWEEAVQFCFPKHWEMVSNTMAPNCILAEHQGLRFVSGNPPEWVGLSSALSCPLPTHPQLGMLFLLPAQSWNSLEDGPEHLSSRPADSL